MFYTGIGARKTPKSICKKMTNVGKHLVGRGYTLRSGAAHGADAAFEAGCDIKQGPKQIFLPWKGHNGHPSEYFRIGTAAYDLLKEYHPGYKNLSESDKKFLGRNTYQILGANHDEPAEFVICWTPLGKAKGGTAFGMRLAAEFEIPIFNLGSADLDQTEQNLIKLLESKKNDQKLLNEKSTSGNPKSGS